MSGKKRKWLDKYVQHGFTCITEHNGTKRLSYLHDLQRQVE